MSRATTIAECLGKTNFVQSNTFFSLCTASWEYHSSYFRYKVLVLMFWAQAAGGEPHSSRRVQEVIQSSRVAQCRHSNLPSKRE